ncbi:MAG TPA: hypothetical protein DCP20_01885 [Coriobacteriia bacterium]|jgi:hypothetical protein|nr:MAG: hypothetical protein XD74_1683 [Actinobacteria bacterium 66_15]HAL29450.1 hypothetical protein [Coriobacteriia bacterium]
MLPSQDEEYLAEKGLAYEYQTEGTLLLIIHDYPLPVGYVPAKTDLLIQIPSGYPGVTLDMFYVDPPVAYATGERPPASDATATFLGRTWQRFSRHLAAQSWRPGIDGLASYMTLIRHDLERGVAA